MKRVSLISMMLLLFVTVCSSPVRAENAQDEKMTPFGKLTATERAQLRNKGVLDKDDNLGPNAFSEPEPASPSSGTAPAAELPPLEPAVAASEAPPAPSENPVPVPVPDAQTLTKPEVLSEAAPEASVPAEPAAVTAPSPKAS
ncbi:MAG TPA: hypothetical protein VL688_09865 [Verrucomicrobiae bacterium]|jgi:hypothetical protein|nr:hypothetical protein [Verrucomicrobiae bacterium]